MNLATPRDASWRSGASRPATVSRPRSASIDVAPAATGVMSGLSVAAATHASPTHLVNEDAHSPLDAARRVFVVADGVGGGALAASVSRALVSHLHAAVGGRTPDAQSLRDAVRDADRAIARSVARRDTACGAATMALCAPQDAAVSRWLIAWVGDCRVYRVSAARDGGAELLTTDDTYRQLDEVPPPGSRADDPARMVGNGAVDVANVESVDLARGAMLVLCSDGVHKHVTSTDIARSMRETGSLERRCMRLVELARAGGSGDDATVLAVQRSSSRRWPVPPFVVGALIGFAAVALLAWLTAPAGLVSSLRMLVPL